MFWAPKSVISGEDDRLAKTRRVTNLRGDEQGHGLTKKGVHTYLRRESGHAGSQLRKVVI